jgi:hypothetical protein
MQFLWKKTHSPHPNNQRKTSRNQNTKPHLSSLVAAAKPPHPHKERKQSQLTQNKPNTFSALSVDQKIFLFLNLFVF